MKSAMGATLNSIRRLLALSLALGGLFPCDGASKTIKIDVKYRRPGSGIGGGSYTGLVFAPEDDRRVNTCAIVKAVGALPAGFTAIPENGLDPKTPYKTDYYRVESTVLSDYNQRNPDLRLPPGPLYGVTYEISYEVKKGFILFQVRSKLHTSGRESVQWHEYLRKNDDTFFSRKLVEAIERQIGECAKSR